MASWAFRGLFVAIVACGLAHAQSVPASLQNGLDWLTAQVRTDGSLANEASSIALPLQVREETQVTLALLATAPTALISVVAANTDANVEAAARRILGATSAGRSPASADIAFLLTQQNADGGWGMTSDFQSDPLDTAFALLALSSANVGTSVSVSGGLSYLAQALDGDGGWGIDGQSSVFVTSYVTLAASAWSSHYSTTALTDAAVAWLLAQRNTASHAYSATLDNALALIALSTQAAQSAALPSMATAMNAAQFADGSWADDPYLTALALRALWTASQPPPSPPAGGAKGAVVDQSSGQPITGVTVQLLEISTARTTSGADGSFNLGGIPSGNYTLQVTQIGYQTSTAPVQITSGQVFNAGTIALVPAPSSANLSGVVRNSSGSPLQNVTVSVGARSTSTNATGVYQMTGLAPGSATITAKLSGYQTATASAIFSAGSNYTFSPTLYSTSETAPGTSAQGIVIDGTTSNPIAGATVNLNGINQITDANGKFVFSGATAGNFTLAVSASGYLTANATGTLAAGVNDLGRIALSLTPTTARLSGVVTNSSGNPLQNVVVSVGTSATSTDATGTYQIAGLSPGDVTITASLPGYQTATTTADLVAGNSYIFSPTLYGDTETVPSTSLQGIVVDGTTNDPIVGAAVTMNGTSQITDAHGKFLFTGLAAGDFSIQASATGYLAIDGTGTLAPGGNDVGTLSLSPAPQATAYQTIASTGPLNEIFVGADLSTQIAHVEDNDFEVYPPETIPGDFGTFIVVGANLYAPHFNTRNTATSDGPLGTYTPYTLVSQAGILGTGSSTDPFAVNTVANVGTTGLAISQTDSYVIGQEAFRTDVTIINTTNDPISAILYRAMDCYLGNSDVGYGLITSTAISCTKNPNNVPAGRIEQLIPLTAGANYYETYYATIWSAIGQHKPFPNTCDCTKSQDNGAGLSWNITVPANGSVTYSNLTNFSPLGNQPLIVTKAVDAAIAVPGDSDGYTITIDNPNGSALVVNSITDTLPAGFGYTPNSSTGIASDDPFIVGQVLTWNGPFALPANGNATLHFAVQVPTTPGTYYNQATANSGTNIVVPTGQTAPVTIQAVTIGVVTDQPAYPANATAQVTTTLTNQNTIAVDGDLTVDVYDLDDTLVGTVMQQSVSIPANASLPVAGTFAIGTILPAQYTVTAVLTHNGTTVAQATTMFTVLPDDGTALATTTVATDRGIYHPTDLVQIDSQVQSQSSNVLLSDLTLRVQVVDAGGTVQFTQDYPIAQLLPGAMQSFSVPQTLTNAPGGVYTVEQDLLDDQRHTLSHAETTYQVDSTSDTGFGLVGTIAATPKVASIGAPLTLDASATNLGNAELANLPLTIYLVDPEAGAVVAQFDQTSTMPAGGSAPFTPTWTTQGSSGTTYLAVLVATVGDDASASGRVLAQDSFELFGGPPPDAIVPDIPVPVPLDVRWLALMLCALGLGHLARRHRRGNTNHEDEGP